MQRRHAYSVVLALLLVVVSTVAAAQSPDEQTVRTTLEAYWTAQNAADLDRSLSFFSDDAMIDSVVAGGKVSKPKYETAVRNWLQKPENRQFRSQYKITKMTFSSPTEAIVDTDVAVARSASFNQGGFTASRGVQWRLQARDGKWLIVETTYTKR
jgi:ketosteroid isomerase-like protein